MSALFTYEIEEAYEKLKHDYVPPILVDGKIDRWGMSSFLNNCMMGFMEGTKSGLTGLVARNLRLYHGVVLSSGECYVQEVSTDKVRLWSLQIDHNGEHYESVYTNGKYDSGFDL
jgi:hypothetical protein